LYIIVEVGYQMYGLTCVCCWVFFNTVHILLSHCSGLWYGDILARWVQWVHSTRLHLLCRVYLGELGCCVFFARAKFLLQRFVTWRHTCTVLHRLHSTNYIEQQLWSLGMKCMSSVGSAW
jgi:hypothetical protein